MRSYIVMVIVALIVLMSLPVSLLPFYATGQAVATTYVAEVRLFPLLHY